MCPDAELLSAWTDGEVPSPWKERIASHLEGCASCADRVAGFRRLSLRLRSSGAFDESAAVAAVAARLGISVARAGAASHNSQAIESFLSGDEPPRAASSSKLSESKRKMQAISLPLAAAAAAAFLVVGLLSGRMLSGSGPFGRGSAASPLAAASETGATSAFPANLAVGSPTARNPMSGSPTMDALVRYLETQNVPVSITIQLPPNGSYAGGGAPMIVKSPPAEAVSLPPSSQGLGFVMSGSGK